MRACYHRAAPVIDYEACEIFQIHFPCSWATCGLEVGELARISIVVLPLKYNRGQSESRFITPFAAVTFISMCHAAKCPSMFRAKLDGQLGPSTS